MQSRTPGGGEESFASLVDSYPPPDNNLKAGTELHNQVREAPARRQKKKRKGRTQPLSLDLHGMTKTKAIAAMTRFFGEVRQKNTEVTVHIIHGKGHHSTDEPVLTQAVQEWLSSKPARVAGVKEFWEGREEFHEGGTGITVCVLKPRNV